MAPPPRPPIICYDLQTISNGRRSTGCSRQHLPVVGSTRRPKVTVVQRDPNELIKAEATACWHQHPLDPPRRSLDRLHLQDQITFSTTNTTSYSDNLNARHAYDKTTRQEAEARERRKEHRRRKLAMEAQLEEISARLESADRFRDMLLKTYGMSHNTARYIQKLDEEFATLRQKVDQFAETRSKELEQRVQQMKKFHQLQRSEDQRIEARRLQDLSNLKHSKREALSSTPNRNSLSPANAQDAQSLSTTSSSLSAPGFITNSSSRSRNITNCSHRTASSSSTISLSPCSSAISTSDETSSTSRNTAIATPKNKASVRFSFYKPPPMEENDSIEVTDMEFFDKAEDKTMMEVNGLVSKMQSALREIEREKHM